MLYACIFNWRIKYNRVSVASQKICEKVTGRLYNANMCLNNFLSPYFMKYAWFSFPLVFFPGRKLRPCFSGVDAPANNMKHNYDTCQADSIMHKTGNNSNSAMHHLSDSDTPGSVVTLLRLFYVVQCAEPRLAIRSMKMIALAMHSQILNRNFAEFIHLYVRTFLYSRNTR